MFIYFLLNCILVSTETSTTYHTKTGETKGQIFLPYILLSHNVIFPCPRLDVLQI
jgi:hypothetical protein